MSLPPALAAMAALPRFITYRVEPHPDRPGKTRKIPTNPYTAQACDPTDTANHVTYEVASATGRGVGFVFCKLDGFWFLDIDGALGADNQWSQLARDLCARLAGAAVEVSQSHRGLHLFGRGLLGPHSCKNVALGLELYTDKRFVALTGINAVGDSGADLRGPIAEIVAQYFAPNPFSELAGWTSEPVSEWRGLDDDDRLIERALASAERGVGAALGTVTFADLWNCNEAKLAERWPSSSGDAFDRSHADAALASHLAFWTGKNCERIRRLMLRSALARDKWEARPDWLELTIERAAAAVSNVATGAARVDAVVAAAAGTTLRDREIIKASEQLQHFQGCVYVSDINRVWDAVTGDFLDKARFDIAYGGYLFPMDPQGSKLTDSAFDAFTRSRVYKTPRANTACFRPELASGAVLHNGSRSMVNTYVAIETPRLAGDAGPFTRHMQRLFPHGDDLAIITTYMASLVRNPGRKFQWWPVIQGCEGNGKSLLSRVMSFCVGEQYSHLVSPAAMQKSGNQFNAWATGNLFVGLEEIYVGTEQRTFLDQIKELITNERIPMEAKGKDQKPGDNRINGMMFSNHKEAIPISVDGRRYAVFYNPQQSYADCVNDGLSQYYFADLYDWCNGRGDYAHGGPGYGYAIINDYLHTCAIEAIYDPAGRCVRAPATTSHREALRVSLGRAEQEIIFATEIDLPGFAGGWISTVAMDRLFESKRLNMTHNRRARLLELLGYVRHPLLADGRTQGPVMPDNARTRLFVTEDHLSMNYSDAAAVQKAYTAAQITAGIGARLAS